MTQDERQQELRRDRAPARGSSLALEARRVGMARFSATAALLVERAWPLVLPLACLVAAFFVLSWFGLFSAMPFAARAAVLVLFGLVALFVLWRNRAFRVPKRDAVDRRIEAASRLRHQPLQVQRDRSTSQDPFAEALWREHQRRMAANLRSLAGGVPNTRTERLDPFGLRAVLALLLVTAFAYSFGPGGGRIADAFTPPDEGSLLASARVDAWVTPPSYTGRAPIFLTNAAAAGTAAGGGVPPAGATAPVAAGQPISVPEGSVLSVRISDGSDAELRFTGTAEGAVAETIAPAGSEGAAAETQDTAPVADGAVVTGPPAPAETGVAESGVAESEAATANGSAPVTGDASDATAGDGQADTDTDTDTAPGAGPAGPRDYSYTLDESGTADLSTTFSTLGEWAFAVVPDEDPTIAFKDEPSEARNGALQLAYTASDDYGVRKAQAEIVVADETVAEDARPIVAPPTIGLSLPRRGKAAASEGKTSADLTESPYAGAKVAMTLVASDAAGQVGRSETKTVTLPEKRFSNPLARAVVEQRRMLALDVNAVPRVLDLLDATTLRGDEFIENPSDFLALKAVRTRIATAYDDDALVSAVDFMWEIALGIEDGNLSLSERRLRDAREKLSEALENGASNEEIDQLMKELREAMNEYMQALAQEMQKQPPMDQNQMGQAQELRPQDLDKMMDRIEDLAKSGSKDAAQQLLSELQQMMDNLQAMRPGQQQQQSGEQNAMQQQMNKMGEMLQRQQKLMDQTFDLGRRQMQRQDQDRRSQQQQGQQQPGQPQEGEPQDGQPQDGQPQNGQQGEPMTAEQLEQMMKQLQAQQGQLQKDLQAMQQEMQGMGMQPSKGFGDAGEAMGKAEGALGQGDDGEAVGQQGRAMQALRDGAKDAMQQMQQAMQQGQGEQKPGQGQMGQGFGGQQPQQSSRDPLGRQRQTQGPDFGQDVGVPDEIDTQRAREILDAIRKRLGDQLSPELERQYLERLLQTP